jgi:hypothetical protein
MPAAASRLGLFAFGCEMVVGRRQGTVRVDRYMDVLMNQQVVARPWADELEIVDEVVSDPDKGCGEVR